MSFLLNLIKNLLSFYPSSYGSPFHRTVSNNRVVIRSFTWIARFSCVVYKFSGTPGLNLVVSKHGETICFPRETVSGGRWRTNVAPVTSTWRVHRRSPPLVSRILLAGRADVIYLKTSWRFCHTAYVFSGRTSAKRCVVFSEKIRPNRSNEQRDLYESR